MNIRLMIQEATPSLNQFIYKHWRYHQTAKSKWAVLLLRAIGNSGNQAAYKAAGRRRLRVERFGRGKGLDRDNLYGGLKRCVVDNLKAFGLLVDDTDEWLDLVAENAKAQRGEHPYTILTLDDI